MVVTITYGSNPRKHIWTYDAGVSEAAGIGRNPPQYICPCNRDINGTCKFELRYAYVFWGG